MLASLSSNRGDDYGGFQDNKIQLQQQLSLEFLKLHQFLHNKEKDILNELRNEGKVLSEEMEANLNQLQEQCLLARDMLANIQTRIEQQNPFDFLKVRFHTNLIMGTLGGKRVWGWGARKAQLIDLNPTQSWQRFKILWEKHRLLLF